MLGSGIYSLATVIFVMLAKIYDRADAPDDRLF